MTGIRTRALFLLLLPAVLAACAASPGYEFAATPDAAWIKGDFPNVLRFFTQGEAHLQILEIDGLPTPGRYGPFPVAPGSHRLGISSVHYDRAAKGYLEIDFEPGRKYRLRGNLRSDWILVQLYDVTTGPPVRIAEFRLKLISPSEIILLPLPVPI